MTDPAGWPGVDAAPAFDEPWEGRSFALAVTLAAERGLSWDDFRAELIAAIDTDPGRPYYESWLLALERLVAARTAIDADELARHRGRAAAYRYLEAGTGDIEVFPVSTEGPVLDALLADLLTHGVPVDGAPDRLLPRCEHAELYRRWADGSPARWGFRMFDRDEHLQLDVELPSPFTVAEGRPSDEPDWDRLACWDELRARHLGLAADPVDRSGPPHPG